MESFGYLLPNNRNGGRPKTYFHVAVPFDVAKNGITKKLVVATTKGNVTNLCDFRILAADWCANVVPSDTVVACKVCMARVAAAGSR